MKKYIGLLFSFILIFAGMALAQAPVTAPSQGSILGKIILFSGIVSGFIQLLKKAAPSLPGPLALAINVVAALVAALSVASPADFKTFNFYLVLGGQLFATAGVHDLASFIGLFGSGKK